VSDIYRDRQLEAIASRWDARAKTWDSDLENPACHLNEDAAYERFLRQARSTIAARRGFCARNGVIDIGCGTGLVLETVISGFGWGMGVDLSPEMLRLAEQKQIPRTTFVVGDCFQLAEFCPPAGAVLSRGVLLSHYGRQQAEDLLRAAKAVLIPGGFVLFDFLNAAARARYAHAAEEKTHFAAPEITSLAHGAGFKTADILGDMERRVLLLLAE
jgi:SAM-dependent methyltransferase